MATIAEYLGSLNIKTVHEESNTTIFTGAAPDNGGTGEYISPTDLCVISLATCAMTMVGMYAENHGLDVKGTTFEVKKTMSANPRRISKIEITFNMPKCDFTDKDKKIIAQTVKTCPVHHSLHPDVEQIITFNW